MQPQSQTIETRHGKIAFWDGGRADGPVALLIHGNSSSKRIFEKQFDSELARHFRLIAPDLPGHGESGEAPNPQGTYFIAGYATALMEFLDDAGVSKAHVAGWSLGGHIALELLARWEGAQSAFIFGTPPIPNDLERAMSAFLPSEHMGLTFQESFTVDEANTFVGQMILAPGVPAPWMIDDALRTDGRTRAIGYQAAIEGRNLDEEEIVGKTDRALAVVHGEHDAFVNLAFLKSLAYATLWRGEVQVIPNVGHTPQWEAPGKFNSLLSAFLADQTHEGPRR